MPPLCVSTARSCVLIVITTGSPRAAAAVRVALMLDAVVSRGMRVIRAACIKDDADALMCLPSRDAAMAFGSADGRIRGLLVVRFRVGECFNALAGVVTIVRPWVSAPWTGVHRGSDTHCCVIDVHVRKTCVQLQTGVDPLRLLALLASALVALVTLTFTFATSLSSGLTNIAMNRIPILFTIQGSGVLNVAATFTLISPIGGSRTSTLTTSVTTHAWTALRRLRWRWHVLGCALPALVATAG